MKSRSLIIGIILFADSLLGFAQVYYPQPDLRGGWRTLVDSVEIMKETGVDIQKLNDAFKYI